MSERLVGGRYRLGKRVGSGGMGHVWLAHDQVLGRSVAVKEILLPEGLTDEERDELRLRTLREARTAARLNHPNVVRVYDVIFAHDRPWIIMEYVPSRSLADAIRQYGPMAPERAARVGFALVDALTAAHAAGVLHRDVKPGNVLLADDGRVMLTDFGLATFEEFTAPLTQTGIVYGSPQYIAPERALDGTSSPAADMWSLGATLYAAVEGQAPYSRQSSYATLAAMATSSPDAPLRAGELEPVLLGLLHRNPRNRMLATEARSLMTAIITDDERRRRVIPRQRRHGEHVRDARVADRAAAAPPQIDPSPARPAVSDQTTIIGATDLREPPTERLTEAARGGTAWASRSDAEETAIISALPPTAAPPQPPAPLLASLPRRSPGASTPDWPNPQTGELSGGWPEALLTRFDSGGSALPDRQPSTPGHDAPWRWAPRSRRAARWVPAAIAGALVLAVGGVLGWHVITKPHAASAATGTPAPTTTATPATAQEQGPPPGQGGGPPPPPLSNVSWLCRPTPPNNANGLPPLQAPITQPLPPGWAWYSDARGYRIGMPANWQLGPGDPTTCFYDPMQPRILSVNAWAATGTDAVGALTAREAELGQPGGLPELSEDRSRTGRVRRQVRRVGVHVPGPRRPPARDRP